MFMLFRNRSHFAMLCISCCFVAATTAHALPDLRILSASAGSDTVTDGGSMTKPAGATVTISFIVRNEGPSGNAGANTLRAYRGTSCASTSNLKDLPVDQTAQGVTRTIPYGQWTVPSQGTRTYFPAIVDFNNVVTETDETDNTFCFSILAGPPPPQADLSVSNFQFSPSTISAGSHPSSVPFTLSNGGPADLDDTQLGIKLYLSRDTTLNTGSDTFIGEGNPSITMFSDDSMTVNPNVSSFTIPLDASEDYYVFVLVEIDQAGLTDPNTGNNSARTSGTINVLPSHVDPVRVWIDNVKVTTATGAEEPVDDSSHAVYKDDTWLGYTSHSDPSGASADEYYLDIDLREIYTGSAGMGTAGASILYWRDAGLLDQDGVYGIKIIGKKSGYSDGTAVYKFQYFDRNRSGAPGTVQFKSSSYTVAESGGSVRIYVSRTDGSSGPASVNYATANGTATAGSDYTSRSGTLNWSDGDAGEKYFDVSITDDSAAENGETFTASLSEASGASLGSPSSTTVTISGPNDQLTGSVQFKSSTYTVAESGGSVRIYVSRTDGSSGAASVNYATANGTATAGSDYTAKSGTLNWSDGDAGDKYFDVSITDDSAAENGETFTASLSEASGASLGSPSSTTVTISGPNDQLTGSVQFKSSTYTVAESGGSVRIYVSRTDGSSGSASVNYATANGAATAGSDYTSRSGTLSWSDGDAADKYFDVPITNDTNVEGNETFTANLSGASGASLGSPSSTTVTITDGVTPREVKVLDSSIPSGGSGSFAIQFKAQGNENAISFSIQWDAAKLTYSSVARGSGVPADATYLPNTSQIGQGRLGLVIALSPGATFPSGTVEIARVSVTAATVSDTVEVPVSFVDQPVPRSLSDANAQSLTTTWTPGTVTITAGYEADVAPRSSGDTQVLVNDLVQEGRFVAGLDSAPASGSEFARADCAPRTSSGDGQILVNDLVQAGRYVARLDSLQSVGGPTSLSKELQEEALLNAENKNQSGPTDKEGAAKDGRVAVIQDATVSPGSTFSLPIVLNTQGNENAVAFSIQFDTTKLTYQSATRGSNVPSDATFLQNTSQTGQGKVGIVIALSPGTIFPAGTRQLVQVSFQANVTATGQTVLSFVDQPIPRSLSDANAQALSATWTQGAVTFDIPPVPILQVTPLDNLVSSGQVAGPFSPQVKQYQVSNTGGGTLNWTVETNKDWVTVSPTSGTNSGTVMVSVNGNANALSPGVYQAAVTFDGNGGSTARQVSLTVLPVECIQCPSYDFESLIGTSLQTLSSSVAAYACNVCRFSLTAGVSYTFKTGCGDGATASFDTVLELHNGSCAEVASNDDACEDNRSKIDYTATESGYHYLKVRGYSGVSGTYTLAYGEEDVPPQITVASPNGDESWQRNTSHDITWTSSGTIAQVEIKLYKAGALVGTISSATDNDGVFNWTVPASQALGTDYKVKITSTSDAGVTDYSNATFSIWEECSPPAAPTGVSATDFYSDRVHVTWNTVSGSGIEYQVYRDGAAIDDWQPGISYVDYGALPPYIEYYTGDCNSTPVFSYHYHDYKVRARNSCGESGYSASNRGHRGFGKSLLLDASIYEKALPVMAASSYSELAVRIMSDEPIDADSVWAVAGADRWFEEGGSWRQTTAGDNRDGWVVFSPASAMPSGCTVLVTVGALTASGKEVGPVSHMFEIGVEQVKEVALSQPTVIAVSNSEITPPLMASSGTPNYRIGPDGVFDEAISVRIPIPAEADPNAFGIYYFSESKEHRGWYRGENVIGWIVPESRRTVEENGEVFIEIQVNHSGVVQLVDSRTASAMADIGMFIGLAVVLGLQRPWRRRRH